MPNWRSKTEQERKAYHKEITDQAIKRTLASEEESRFPIDACAAQSGLASRCQ